MYNVNAYSVDIAKQFGPISSIYITMLCNNGCTNSDSVIDLSRSKIYDVTGVGIDKQKEAEDFLSKLGIISIKKFRGNDNKNHYSINFDRIEKLKESPKLVNDLFVDDSPKKKLSKPKETKREMTIRQIKNCINISDEVLRQNLYDWVDSVFESGNFMSRQSVKISIEELLKFSDNIDTQISVVKLATKRSWKDLAWAMDKVDNSEKYKKSGNNFAKYSDIKGNCKNTVSEAF